VHLKIEYFCPNILTRSAISQTGAKIKNIQKDINVYKLEHYLNSSGVETEQDAVKKVTELWAAYNNALPLGMV
jgi:hypothetical protein